MKDIRKIVNKHLTTKYQINESFEQIFLYEDEDKRFDKTINYFGKLIDEGYDDNQLKSVVEEQFGWLKNLFGGSKKDDTSLSGSNMLGKSGSGAFSQFKEYLISKFLNFLGFEGPFAEALSTAMSEINLMDLINLFRSRQGCIKYGPIVADALSEAIVTYIMTSTRKDSTAFNFLRNTVFEYVKSSHFGETVSKFVCDAAYNAKGKLMGS